MTIFTYWWMRFRFAIHWPPKGAVYDKKVKK